MHVIPPRVMQSGTLPPQTQVIKIYWSKDLEKIKGEFEKVKMLGPAAAEEWIKGLEIRGKQSLVDVARWEKWDLAGGAQQTRLSFTSVKAVAPHEAEHKTPVKTLVKQPVKAPDSAQQIPQRPENQNFTQSSIPGLSMQPDTTTPPRPQGQQKRTKEQVAQSRAKRRAEIERRAMLLDPPLTANVLAHIPSFQAALQIPQPLDDNAWDLLEPRLLAQRKDAEQREEGNTANMMALQGKRGLQPGVNKPAREPTDVPDKEWDDVQGPLRGRISGFADEIIERWNNGEAIKKKSSPQFAADVLLYVRKRFYAEVAKDAAAAVASGKEPIVDPPEGPWTQKLTLENMKWVFDVKVRPLTESFRKELFLCRSCDIVKFFGFEGVLQHYAAKHTNVLSLGNVVVHWRAEWPPVSPFNPEPRAFEAGRLPQRPSTSQPLSGTYSYPGYPGYQGGLAPGYAPPGYGLVGPLSMPAYSSDQHMPAVTGMLYAQGAPFTYGAPFTQAAYPQTTGYAPYSLGPAATAPFSSYEQGDAYATPTLPTPENGAHDRAPGYAGSHDAKTSTHRRERLETLAVNAGVFYFKTVDESIPAAVKLCIVVYMVGDVYAREHHEPLTLSMFDEALTTNENMRRLRHIKSLICKQCFNNRVTKGRKSQRFLLPALTKHFMKEHADIANGSGGFSPIDWQKFMVYASDDTVLGAANTLRRNNSDIYPLLKDTFEHRQLGKAFAQDDAQKASRAVKRKKLVGAVHESLVQANTNIPRARDFKAVSQTVPKDSPQGLVQNPGVAKENGNQAPVPASAPAPAHSVPPSFSGRDIPYLRPASEVYGRKGHTSVMDTGNAQESRVAQPDFHPPRDDDSYTPELAQGDIVIPKQEYNNSAPGLARQHHYDLYVSGTSQRGAGRSDYNVSREYNGHASYREPSKGVPPLAREVTAARGRSVSVGFRPDERGQQGYSQPMPESEPRLTTTQTEPGPSSAERVGNSRYQATQISVPHHREAAAEPRAYEPTLHDDVQEEVVYVDISGREIGRGLRARNDFPRETAYHDGYPTDSSTWYNDYPPTGYREQMSSRHTTSTYREPQHAYYDYPAEAYELVEVRDPRGDYFIRRPVQQDRSCPSHDQAIYQSCQTQGFSPRAASMAPGQSAQRFGYDTRYAESGTREFGGYNDRR